MKNESIAKETSYMLFSIIIAMMLTTMPLPIWAIWYRPQWLLLVLIFWLITTPHRIGLSTVWGLGLLLDVLQGTLLGAHSLAMVMIAYIVIKMHRQISPFLLWQQAVMIGLLTMIYQSIIAIIQGISGDMVLSWHYWLSSLTSMVLWPFVSIILQNYNRRLKIY